MSSYIDDSKQNKKSLLKQEDISFDNFDKDNSNNEPIYNSNIIEVLNQLIEDLDKIRDDIRRNKLYSMNEEEIKSIDKRFSKAIDKYDEIKKKEEDLTKEENSKIEVDSSRIIYIDKCLSAQTSISRIAHKINNYKNDKLRLKYENKLEEIENKMNFYNNIVNNFKEEIKNSRESTLTISSLVFTAFTLIQLNFTAFQNSNTYSVLDRIILFSGINIFTILGIYTIFALIKSFINKEKLNFSLKEDFYKPEIISVSIFLAILVVIFSYTLYLKSSKESESIKEITALKEKINSFTKLEENINLLKINISNLKTKLEENIEENNEKTQSKINNLKLELQTEMLNVEKEIFILEKKLDDINQKAKEK